MEGHGKVAAHSVTDSACGRNGGEEEGGSHFQKLLSLPEPSAASNMQIISLSNISLLTASLEPHESPIFGAGRDAPYMDGMVQETHIPWDWLRGKGPQPSSLALPSCENQSGRDLQPTRKSRNWEVAELLECSRKKSGLALWLPWCTEVKSLKSDIWIQIPTRLWDLGRLVLLSSPICPPWKWMVITAPVPKDSRLNEMI